MAARRRATTAKQKAASRKNLEKARAARSKGSANASAPLTKAGRSAPSPRGVTPTGLSRTLSPSGAKAVKARVKAETGAKVGKPLKSMTLRASKQKGVYYIGGTSSSPKYTITNMESRFTRFSPTSKSGRWAIEDSSGKRLNGFGGGDPASIRKILAGQGVKPSLRKKRKAVRE